VANEGIDRKVDPFALVSSFTKNKAISPRSYLQVPSPSLVCVCHAQRQKRKRGMFLTAGCTFAQQLDPFSAMQSGRGRGDWWRSISVLFRKQPYIPCAPLV